MYKTISEKELKLEWSEIQAAQEDPAQFRVIYKRYYNDIFRFIYRRTTNEDLTSELCSLVFLKALKRLDTFEYRGVPFSAWLFRIASNEVGQHFRKLKKNRVVSIEEKYIPEITEEINEPYSAEFMDLMIEVLDELDEKELQVIEMRFFEQMPFKEIADILNITESNAKVRTYRILERLKKRIVKRADTNDRR